jgi:hypothetical protein
MHLFRQQHILIIALELFLYPPAGRRSSSTRGMRAAPHQGIWVNVSSDRSPLERLSLPACRSLICVEASPVDEPDTAKYTQTLRCGARRCIISFAFSDEKRQQSR